MQKLVARRKRGRGFCYVYAGTGRLLRCSKTRQWIKSLAIPPAWQQVFIDLDRSAKVWAWGRDAKGRKQYIYNESWRHQRETQKFNRLPEFADRLAVMRKATTKHLRKDQPSRYRVLACMVRLLDNAYFRPGCVHYTAENESYGLTTLRSKHLEIHGSRLEFTYKGKSGQLQHKVLEDRRLAEVVKQIEEIPGYEIFKYLDEQGRKVNVTPEILNEYIADIMGSGFTAKDFRTWAGTYLAAVELSELGWSESEREREKNIIKAIDHVAKKLGNTRAVTRAHYVSPRIIEHYRRGLTIAYLMQGRAGKPARRGNLSQQERAVKKLLQTALRRKKPAT